MTYIVVSLLGIAFLELFRVLRLADNSRVLLDRSRDAIRAIQSPAFSDEEKEKLARAASLAIIKATVFFLAKFAALCALLYAAFLALVTVRPDMRSPLLEGFVSPAVILVASLVVLAYYKVRHGAR